MSELFATGLEITLIGMGVVFVLLTLLVFVVEAMSRLARYLEGPPGTAPDGAPPADDRLTAVITAAVHAYRARHRRK